MSTPHSSGQPFPAPLFVLDLANNHMGQVDHGLRIVDECARALEGVPYRVALKLQYRHLDTFIHPDFQRRFDLKYVKRFQETRLTDDDFARLRDRMRERGFLAACTPFDERSVDLAERHGFEILKIASASFTDWPLLERMGRAQAPVIASTGGASLEDIDKVVSFFTHRNRPLALMHCVAVYPTPSADLQLNQIDLLRARYPEIPVGFSTHETPAILEPVQLAVAKGATIFEKHVGVPTDAFSLNAYSATPADARRWVDAAALAYEMCGTSGARVAGSDEERASLRSLRRGVYVSRPVADGERIDTPRVFFAMPVGDNQYTANDWSKYAEVTASKALPAGAAVASDAVRFKNHYDLVYDIAAAVRSLLKDSGVAVPRRADLEISHHYGLDRFYETGLTMITVVNREYCKKLIVLLPGQNHPEQFHRLKEETFQLLHGDLKVVLDDREFECQVGEVLTVERNVRHRFWSERGAIVEEVSSTHEVADSYYTDPDITKNAHRKTFLTYWLD